MTDLTPERLAELKALEKAATPGLWMRGSIDRTMVRSASHLGIASATEPNAAFIAALRNAASTLIAAAEERDRQERLISEWQTEGRKHVARLREIDTLRALLARAGEAMEEACSDYHLKEPTELLAEIRRATQGETL